jgi:glycosyltransferase involved in cell wall biosynthesis
MSKQRNLLIRPPENLRPGLVSVGVPVYNGEPFLREALDALLAQDYPDFEIIISDNASTDGTADICQEYTARDSRVRYYRSDENKGPSWNWIRTYELARGEYFLWAAHDDRRDSRCLRLCVEALKQNPRAVMCCMGSRIIDENGCDITEEYAPRIFHPTGDTARERVCRLAHSSTWLDIYAMFRTPIIAETSLGQINIWGGDIVITAEMCLRGEVVAVPETLFEYRVFRSRTADVMAAMQSEWGSKVSVSWISLAADLMECIRVAPLRLREKLATSAGLAVESCIRNPDLSWSIRRERFRGLGAAIGRHDFRRAWRVLALGMLSQTAGAVSRVKNSAKYRGGLLKSATMRRHSPSSTRS